MGIKVHPDWWKTLFDEMYLKTDARSVCDPELSGREVDVICDLLQIKAGHRILDLCGGQGRHSLELSNRGYTRCTVVDYSPHLVQRGRAAARENGCSVDFIQGDARDTGLTESAFDHVLIMGNSLGYLPEPDDDVKILLEAFRVLKPGARLLVDVADGERVHKEMVPNVWHEIDEDLVVCRERERDGDRVMAREMIFSRRKGLLRDQSYAIRVYRPGEIEMVVRRAGFAEVTVHRNFRPHGGAGDYGFMNRRILITGTKPATGAKRTKEQ